VSNPLSETPHEQIQREFNQRHCAVCSKDKKRGEPFCNPCKLRLPSDMQTRLLLPKYRLAAYQAAREWLVEERRKNEPDDLYESKGEV